MKTRAFTILLLGAGLVAGCGDDLQILTSVDGGPDANMTDGEKDANTSDSRDGAGDSASDALGDGSRADGNVSDTALGDASMGDGSAADSGADAGVDAAPTMVMGTITTTGGGQLQVGGATVTVQGGTVTADTTVTLTTTQPVSETPNRIDVSGSLYTLAPAGTSFSSPISVTLPVPANLPAGKSPTVAWYDDVAKVWVALPSAWRSGDAQITALTTRAGTFSVLLGEGSSGGPQGSTTYCPKIESCGGALVGTYSLTSSCSQAGTTTEVRVFGTGKATLVATTERSGTVTFTGEAFQESFAVSQRRDVVADEAATSFLKDAGKATCAAIASEVLQLDAYSWVCSGDVNSRCVCSGRPTQASEPITVTGTFTTNGGKLNQVPSVGLARPVQDYCVRDNALSLRDNRGNALTASKSP